jgi:hypothetical protein
MTIKYAPLPFVNTFLMFAEFKLAEAKAAKKVWVELYDKSKTRISISIKWEDTVANVNFIPKGSEGYKFDEVTTYSYASYTNVTSHYWKLNKKQGMRTLEDHLKNLVAQIFGIGKEDEFTIIVIRSRAFNALNMIEPVSVEQFATVEDELPNTFETV